MIGGWLNYDSVVLILKYNQPLKIKNGSMQCALHSQTLFCKSFRYVNNFNPHNQSEVGAIYRSENQDSRQPVESGRIHGLQPLWCMEM